MAKLWLDQMTLAGGGDDLGVRTETSFPVDKYLEFARTSSTNVNELLKGHYQIDPVV